MIDLRQKVYLRLKLIVSYMFKKIILVNQNIPSSAESILHKLLSVRKGGPLTLERILTLAEKK